MYIKRKLALFMVFMMCFSLMPAMTFATDSAPQLTKTAEWVDSEAGTAKITLKVQGTPITVNNPGVDVVVVMDYSGSMGICNSINFTRQYAGTDYDWPWAYNYYHYTCTECGEKYSSTYWDHRYDAPAYCSKNMSPDSRWDKSKTALNSALNQIIPNTSSPNRVAFVAFDSKVKSNYKAGFTEAKSTITSLAGNLARPYPGDGKGTNYTAGLGQAYDYLNADAVKNNGKAKYVIFLSDGEPNYGSAGNNEIANIKALAATVYTIGIELDASANTTLKGYATSNAYHYNVTNLNDLDNVFTNIAQTVSSGVKVTDVVNLDKFDVMSIGTPTSGSASLSTSDLKTVKWNLSNFKTAGDTLEIYIKLNAANKDKYQQFITNESAGATYIKSDGTTGILAVSSTAPSSERPMVERSKKTYTITFSAGSNGTLNGTVSYPNIAQTTKWGDAGITVPTPVPNAGYEFDKWTPEIPPGTSAISNSQEYVASFKEAQDITIEYKAGEGGSVSPVSESLKPVTETAQGSTATAYPGYNFVNWTNSAGAVVSTDPHFIPTKVGGVNVAATYTANFAEKAQYTLSYDANGGNGVMASETKYEGENFTVSTNGFTRADYKFKNWNTQANGNGTSYAEEATIPANQSITLFAQWEELPAMIVNAEGYTGAYDGAAHGIAVTAPAGATVKYGTSARVYNLTEAPMYENVGVTTVYYEVTQEGYKTVTGNATVKITPATIEVTANDKSKVYREADPVFDYTNTRAVAAETAAFAGALARVAGENVGNYDINQGDLVLSDNEAFKASNYTLSFTKGKLEITAKGVTVTADAKTKVYGDSDPELTYTSSVEGVTFTGALAREAGDNAGTYAINQGNLSAGDNYKVNYVGANLTITPKAATVTTGSDSKAYDGDPLTNATVTLDGILEDDDVTATATGSQTVVGTSANTVTISGAAKGNYTFTETLGKLTVTEGTLTYSANGYEDVYDGNQYGITVTSDGATITYGTEDGTYNLEASPTYKNVGDYTVYYQIERENYKTVAGSEVVKITPKAATVTTGSDSKAYDGDPLTNAIVTLDGILEDDDVTATATGSQTVVGTSANTVTISGAAKGNYTF
ncbi:MAG: MBG domain-containing protein, partial [Eubacteriales bacterium]|nr:MBG domain-containing protein [Eubacteriales bacterium]